MPLVHFSKRALENSRTIELCNNDCGAYIYKLQGQYYNAEVSKKDSLHKTTCSVLLKTWMIAESLNWFPDYAFLLDVEELVRSIKKMHEKEMTVKKLLEEIERLDKIGESLTTSLKQRKNINEQARIEWSKEKARKKAGKIKRATQ